MADETYNGWTNRETWAVALHIDNDEGWHNMRNELCRAALEAKPTDHFDQDQATRFALQDSLKDWVEELSHNVFFPDGGSSHDKEERYMFHDVGSLWRVNWDEIASNWLQDFENVA